MRPVRSAISWLSTLILVAMVTAPPTWAMLAAAAVIVTTVSARAQLAARRRRRLAHGPPTEAISLGADSGGRHVVLSGRQLSAHALIVGASGAGKSTTLLKLLGENVRLGRPVVAIDMKGSPAFAKSLRDAAAAAGRPFRIWTPEGPSGWNPLSHGNPTELKDKLIASEHFTEPHYQRAAERYVQTALQVLAGAHPRQAPTLEEVARLMDPHRLPGLLRGAPREFSERVQDYIACLTPDQLSAIRGLGTRLALVTESHVGAFLKGGAEHVPSVDVREALAGDAVVLFSLNSSTYGRLASQLGALAIQDLVAAAGDRLSANPHGGQAMIGIDEFSALGSDNVISLLARCRESGVSVLLATQELADLDRTARGLRDQVLGSTAVKIAHRQDVPSSAQTIARMAGTETVWEQTRQMSSHPLFGQYDTGRGTRRQADRFVINPDQISSLATGEAVVITKLPRAQVRTVRVYPQRLAPGPERLPRERDGHAQRGPELG